MNLRAGEDVAALRRERDELRAEIERLREEMAEWESAHAAVVELRGLVESHMDTARGQWECVGKRDELRAEVDMWHRHYAGLLNEAHDENERLRAEPHQCPVCFGVGQVANGFYARVGTTTWAAASLNTERCRSCDGSGIVWQT